MATDTEHKSFQPQINRRLQKIREGFIEYLLLGCGLFSILVTIFIGYIVVKGSIDFFMYKDGPKGLVAMNGDEIKERAAEFCTGKEWNPGFANPHYGIVPLLLGTFVVTLIAALIALPIGVATAMYLSEYAAPRVRSLAKPTLEVLAGIPTVVYGFFAITAVTPFLSYFFAGNIEGPQSELIQTLIDWHLLPWFSGRLGDPYNQLAGGIVVGIMIIPMVASLSEDALRAVPRSLRDASYALGANKFDTSVKVVLPAALSGVTASFLLAISRAIGETMAVSLACGQTPRYFLDVANLDANIDPRMGSSTMTSFIVSASLGDAPAGTTYFNSLFAVAAVLFFSTLFMNAVAQRVVRRYRQVYQ